MNRYIRTTDPRADEIDGLSLYRGRNWHFRPWEYTWALGQFDPGALQVLDAGSGVNHPLQHILSGRCVQTVAVDLDPRMDSMPRTPYLERHCGSFCSMPYLDTGSIGQVFCISVLEHMEPCDRCEALHEFRRVLRPGGSLVLTMDCPRVPVLDLLAWAAAAGLHPVGGVSVDEHDDDVTFDWRPGITLRVWRGLFR